MSERYVIVGVNPDRRGHVDAVTLGADLARLTGTRLLLASVFKPGGGDARSGEHAKALHRAVIRLEDRLRDLECEEIALSGGSAGQVLAALAEEYLTEAIVVASSPRATVGHVQLGRMTQRLLDGTTARVAVAPAGYAGRAAGLRSLGVAYAPGSVECDRALRYAARLAAQAGAALRVLVAFDPENRFVVKEHAYSEAELAAHARWVLDESGTRPDRPLTITGALLEGDPVDALASASAELDLLVMGSHGSGGPRVVLLGDVAGPLLHRAACALLVVPKQPVAPPIGSEAGTRARYA